MRILGAIAGAAVYLSLRQCSWNVVAMLEVPVTVVDMIHVIAVGDRLACVTLIVRARVAGVYRLLGMVLLAVHVVDVVVVLDGLAPSPGWC